MVLIMLERAKSSILPNENFREFFLWRGEFCVFKTGIPGGPGFMYACYFTFILAALGRNKSMVITTKFDRQK